jgi:uncharacterized membrane protein
MFNQLLETIVQRPYVFLFLAAYLVLALKRWGWRKTVLWLVSGYLIAWVSEISSIHNGFPYGHYKYVYENMPGELMIGGVPFFDSLSYPFLTFAAFMTAWYLYHGVQRRALTPDTTPAKCRRGSVRSAAPLTQLVTLIALGALLTMMLDIIIDPVATMGEKWFLGRIHYYVHPGWYFGVPLTNFAGWFLVAFCIIGFNVAAWHAFPNALKGTAMRSLRWSLEPAFYCSIALFQIAMAFIIGEFWLSFTSAIIIVLIIALLVKRQPHERMTIA